MDKHAQRCRSCHAVTCVDCSVTFYGDDYAQHITCVSEAEKYEKTLYKPKAVKANPQDIWNDLIQSATSDTEAAPAIVRPYLARLGELNNVPRNKKKFMNFAKNSLRLYSDNTLEALWTYLDLYRGEQKKETDVKPTQTLEPPVVVCETSPNVSDDEKNKKDKKKMKKEKRKREEEAEVTTEATKDVDVEEDKKEKKKKSKKEKSQ